MDFTLFDNDQAPDTDVFTGPQTGLVKAAGMAVMRGGVKVAKGAALLGSVAFPSEGDQARTADRIIPRKEDFYRFIDERLEPAQQFWTPDPATLTTAGKVVSALGEMPLQLAGGIAGMTTSVVGNTGVELADQGVDAKTAGAVAAGVGVATTAMGALPQGGSTLVKTGLLALLNPVTGAATDLAARKALESQGYTEQAKAFDPLDPAARSVDMALGIIFGGVAHYGRWREKAPTTVVDSIDTVEKAAHAQNLNPFEPGTAPAKAHDEALTAALDAVDEGKPVNVADHFVQPNEKVEPTYTAQRFREDVKEVFGANDEQADAALALVAARARVEGKDLDSWISTRIAGVEKGAPEGAQLFQNRPIVEPFYSKLLAEVEGLQQEKWSGPELLAKLKKTPGIKEEEIAWTGLDDFLREQNRVSKEDVWSFLSDNKVRMQEVVKGDQAHQLPAGFTVEQDGNVYVVKDRSGNEVGAGIDRDSAIAQFTGDSVAQNAPRYESYVLPGGENYRELLLTLPESKGTPYESSHYEEPNILAHVRFNERTGNNGERVLHLEEVQSDWHQARRDGKAVPDAPFAKSWQELVMRRMLRWAAEHGFDRLTWTTGEQQAERYDISKRIDAVRYYKEEGSVGLSLIRDGKEIARHEIPEASLKDAVGKELAEKIRRGEGHDTGTRYDKELSGVELKVGGEGMKGFYDRILPQYMDKLARRFSSKVEPADVATGAESAAVHSVRITDAMRNALLYEGQPLFQGEKGAVSFLADSRAVIHALEAPDFSTLVHEVSHVFEASLTNLERRELDTWMHSQVPGAKWSVQQRELFARTFERYLAEGKAPVAELQGVFEKFKNWLLEVYQRITGTAIDVRLNDQVRGIFDRMLFADQIKKARDPQAVQLQAELQSHAEGLKTELREVWGDDEEPAQSVVLNPGAETDAPQPTPMSGPLGDPLDVANSFARNPRQVPEMLSTFLESEARALETAESGKHVIDGYQKSATWSNAPDWFLERNRALRELRSNAVSKESTVNALRKAARGEWDQLTAGQQDMVLEAVHAVGGQIDAMSHEITGSELKPGDSFTTTHLEQRVVVGERDGRLILDSGETIPADRAFRVVGEVDSTGRTGEAPTTAADIILQSRGDFEVADGTNADGSARLRSAREMLDEARDAVVIEQNRKPLYHRAAVCMGLG